MVLALVVFDQPQGHRDVVHDLRDVLGDCGCGLVGVDAYGVGGSRGSGLEWEPSIVQRDCNGARFHHDFLLRDAVFDWWFRELVRSDHVGCSGHGLSSIEQHFVLVVASILVVVGVFGLG